MENATQKETTIERRVATKPLVLNCGVCIRGAELVPEKLLAIIDYHLTHVQQDAGVHAITFRNDDRPANKLGTAHPWSYSAAINLQRIFDLTWDKVRTKDWGLNLRDAVWLGVLETVVHEISHVHTAFQDEQAYEDFVLNATDKDRADDEDFNKEVARGYLADLFKIVDCEAPSIEEMGFIGGLIHEVFVKFDNNAFVQRSKIMLEQDMAYQDAEGETKTYYKTLRDYVRNSIFKDEKDFGEDDLNLIKVTFHMETGEDVVADAQPVVDAQGAMPQPVVQEAVAEVLTSVYTSDGDAPVEDDNADMQAVLAVLGNEDGMAVADPAPANADTIILPAPETVVAAPDATAHAPATPAVQPDAYVAPDGEEFQLPDHIAQQQATAQAAAAGPAQTPMPTNLPDLGIPMEKVQGCLQEVYMRLYNHMFTKCGWALNPQTGRYGFNDVSAVLYSVSVQDILQRWGCEGLIHEYSGYPEGHVANAQSRADVRYNATAGHLQGILYSKGATPAYEIFLNIGGTLIQRRLVAQNPYGMKKGQNAYTNGADFAAAGNAVMYVFTDAGYDRPWHERCRAKVVNKVYEEQKA